LGQVSRNKKPYPHAQEVQGLIPDGARLNRRNTRTELAGLREKADTHTQKIERKASDANGKVQKNKNLLHHTPNRKFARLRDQEKKCGGRKKTKCPHVH